MNTDALQELVVEQDQNCIRVDVSNWQRAAQIAKEQLHCQYFSYLSAIDWLPNPDLNGEKVFVQDAQPSEPQEVIVDPVIRKAGGASRFQLIANVYNVETHEGVMLATDLDDESPTAPTWTSVYKGADWHERETWEMFGINFDGHPGLRHIYLPEEFEGHPLRKDFPLVAREVRPWPGLVDMEEMPKPEAPVIPAKAGTQETPATDTVIPDQSSEAATDIVIPDKASAADPGPMPEGEA